MGFSEEIRVMLLCFSPVTPEGKPMPLMYDCFVTRVLSYIINYPLDSLSVNLIHVGIFVYLKIPILYVFILA